MTEIMEHLTEHQDSEDKQLECAATLPPMILNPVEKSRRFYNENGKSAFGVLGPFFPHIFLFTDCRLSRGRHFPTFSLNNNCPP